LSVLVLSMEDKEKLASRFPEYSKYHGHFEKAINTVLGGGVKKHVFLPSGRILYTVVGRSGDEFIESEKPFCSCEHFFYRVLGGRDELCYHLLAHRIALQTQMFDQVEFQDEEHAIFVRLLAQDLLNPIRDRKRRERSD